MKIVHIIPSLEKPGGAETLCVNLVIALSKLGYEVKIITLYGNLDFYKNQLIDNRITYYCLNKRVGLDIKNSLRLRKLIKNIRPNIVHSHLNTYVSFFLGGIYNLRNIKFFHTIHFSMSDETRPNYLIYRFIKHYEKRGSLQHIAISHEVQKYFLKHMDMQTNIPIIYNGTPIRDYLNKAPLTERKKDFICIANFSANKNHSMLLDAFKIVVSSNPKASLVLVGDGLLREQIELKINMLGLNNNVFILGTRKDIPPLLFEHKYFILPSVREGNPISVLEAMAAGLVVLVTKHGGAKDVIINGKNGFLLDPFSKDQVAKEMIKCLKNKVLNNQIQKNNLLKIKNYDILKSAKKHLKLYKNH